MAGLKDRATQQSGALSILIALKNRDDEYKPLEVFECEYSGPRCVLVWLPLVTNNGGREFIYRPVLEAGTRRDHSDRVLDDDSPDPGPCPLLEHRTALSAVFNARYEALLRFLVTRS
jgi:hypothetical protein